MSLQGPCTPNCPNRSWDCHGKCEEYLKYAKKNEEERERIFKKKQIHYILDDLEGDRYYRLEKFKKGLMKPRKD